MLARRVGFSLAAIILVAKRRLSLGNLVEASLPLILWLLFFLYPIVTNVAFDAFPCCASAGLTHSMVAPWADV